MSITNFQWRIGELSSSQSFLKRMGHNGKLTGTQATLFWNADEAIGKVLDFLEENEELFDWDDRGNK